MTTASNLPLRIPAPSRNACIEVDARFRLGVTLDGIEVTYDYDHAYGTIYLRAMREPSLGTLHERMRAESGVWLAMCNVDEGALKPVDVEIDFADVDAGAGPLATVIPVVLEAIAIFYDSDETTTLHRRTLRAFFQGLSINAAGQL